MTFEDGHSDVPPGKLAFVVTSLEMRSRPSHRPVPETAFSVCRIAPPALDWYRDLFHRVGADWLWFSRLRLSDDALTAIIADPAVEIYALRKGEADVGLLELDFRVAGECELAFFGVTPEVIGRGAGRTLMAACVEHAWSRPIERLWVHTCTADHPSALGFYQRSGFVPFKLQVEIADDPRLLGELPLDAAPHVPLIRPR